MTHKASAKSSGINIRMQSNHSSAPLSHPQQCVNMFDTCKLSGMMSINTDRNTHSVVLCCVSMDLLQHVFSVYTIVAEENRSKDVYTDASKWQNISWLNCVVVFECSVDHLLTVLFYIPKRTKFENT